MPKKVKEYIQHDIGTFTPVQVDIPNHLKQQLTPEQLLQLERSCLTDYAQSKITMEQSIADVAVKDKEVLAFANALAKRIITVMDICIEQGIEVNGVNAIPPDPHKLKTILGFEPTILPPDFYTSLKKNELLTKIVNEKLGKKKEGIEEGNVSAAGFVGLSPMSLRHSAQEGNIREAMLIPYKTAFGFFSDFLDNPEYVKTINTKLEEKKIDWRLSEEVINNIKEELAKLPQPDPANPAKKRQLLQYGAYASNRGMRETLSKESRAAFIKSNPKINDEALRVPLSNREKFAYAKNTDINRSESQVKWESGKSWFEMGKNPADPVAISAAATREPLIAGISGTTDQVLTLAYCLGFFDDKAKKTQNMETCRLACLGWMIDAGDHTFHEICSSSKSLGMNYTPAPDSYKQIKTQDKGKFEVALKEAQKRRGYKMPDAYLTQEAVLQKAIELKMVHPETLFIFHQPASTPASPEIQTKNKVKPKSRP